MAEKIQKQPSGRKNTNNASNMVRSVLFMFVMICFGLFLINSVRLKSQSRRWYDELMIRMVISLRLL